MTITFDESPLLVESKQMKGSDIIRIQPIGTRREYCFKFDVSCNLTYTTIVCLILSLQSQLEHQMWFKYFRTTIHKHDATQGDVGPLVLEGGGFVQMRDRSPGGGSPGRRARDLGHTRSVPLL